MTLEKHHTWHDADVMLPAVAELMPPVELDDFGLIDAVDGPKITLSFIEEDGLVNWFG